MKKLKFILLLMVTSIFFAGCNDEDNIMDIFVSGEWTLGNYFDKGNMDDSGDPGMPRYTPNKIDDLEELRKIRINFKNDFTADIRLTNSTCTARWQANPTDRSVRIYDITAKKGLMGKDAEFISSLKEAKYYAGDSNILKLGTSNKRSYMQLGHFEHEENGK